MRPTNEEFGEFPPHRWKPTTPISNERSKKLIVQTKGLFSIIRYFNYSLDSFLAVGSPVRMNG